MNDAAKHAPTFLKRPRDRVRDAKKRVIELSRQPSISFVEMARALREIHDSTKAKEFRESAKIAGISIRKAYQFVKIRNALENHWDEDRFEQIGWTKLCIIAAHVVDRTSPVEQWLKFAETHTARECQLRLEKKPFKNETRCMLLRFDDNQYKAFSKAVLKLGAKQRGKGLIGVERALISAVRKMRQASLL